jgi:hypothetical protein
MTTIPKLETGDIVFSHGKGFIARAIETIVPFIPRLFKNEDTSFIPSHCFTIFLEGDEIYCGESVWPRYKIDDFLAGYTGKNSVPFVIKRPKDPFTDAEKEAGKEFMLSLSSKGIYAFWVYPAYVWYAITGKPILFPKEEDNNLVCFESSVLVAAKMRPELFPLNYDFMDSNALDLYNNPELETIYKNF